VAKLALARTGRWLDEQDLRLDELDGFDHDLPRCLDGFRRVALYQRT
jgi:hypothetical protein